MAKYAVLIEQVDIYHKVVEIDADSPLEAETAAHDMMVGEEGLKEDLSEGKDYYYKTTVTPKWLTKKENESES